MPALAYLDALTSRCGTSSFLWYHTCLCHKPWYHRRKPGERASSFASQTLRLRPLPRRNALPTAFPTRQAAAIPGPPLISDARQMDRCPITIDHSQQSGTSWRAARPECSSTAAAERSQPRARRPGQKPSIASYWTDVRRWGRVGARPLISLALPSGIEPLSPP
jgi:hypothetical protein